MASALLPLKEYILCFQQAESTIDKLFDNQIKVLKDFLSNFIKPEILNKLNSPSKLKKIYCSKPENHLKQIIVSWKKPAEN